MKKTIGIVAASALAIAAFSAPAAANQKDFGQLHKAINAGAEVPGLGTFDSVGKLLQVVKSGGDNPGQTKKTFQS
jgi:predicted amino acid dehydrogenase